MAVIMRKRFGQTLHDQTDIPARIKAKAIIAKLGYNAIDNPNKLGVDLLIYKDDNPLFNVECEVKTNWKGENFKFPDVNMLERKAKYCKLDQPTYFRLFNEDLSNYLIIKDKDLIKAPKEMVRNKYVPFGEYFYKVSLNKVTFNKLEL